MMSACASTKIQRDPHRPGQVCWTTAMSGSSLLSTLAKAIFESQHLASTRRDQSIVGGAADLPMKFKDQYTEQGSESQIFKCLQSYKFYKVLPHESLILHKHPEPSETPWIPLESLSCLTFCNSEHPYP